MTIALGLLASDGIVIAADGQLTAGQWKLPHGKIWSHSRVIEAPSGERFAGSLVMTGTGDIASLAAVWDALSPSLSETFTFADLEANLGGRLRDFYRDHIIPFAVYPPEERPFVQVILGASYSTGQSALWRAESTPLISGTPYCALGSGSLLALTTLGRCYRMPLLGLAESVCLAGYTIQLVKDSDVNCGKRTDVACLKNGSVAYFTRSTLTAIERATDAYGQLAEPFGLRRAFGDTEQDVHAMIDASGFVEARDRIASELQGHYPLMPDQAV